MTHASRSTFFQNQLFSINWLLIAFGVTCLTLSWLAPEDGLKTSFLAAGASFIVFALASACRAFVEKRSANRSYSKVFDLVEYDIAACVLADLDGVILRSNREAQDATGLKDAHSIRDFLSIYVADAAGLSCRIQRAALADGIGSEKVVLPQQHLKVTAYRVGKTAFMWRCERFQEGGQKSAAGAEFPTLTLGRGGTILWMNDAARKLSGGRVRTISDMIEDTPLRSGSVHQIGKTGTKSKYSVNIQNAGLGRDEVILIPATHEPKRTKDAGFEALPVPLLKLTSGGMIVQANHAARDLLDVSEVTDRCLSDCMEGLGRSIDDWLEDAASGKSTGKSEFLRLTRSDRDVFVQVTLTRTVESGEAFLIAVLNDATELKSLEAQFVQSQKMQAIGQRAGGVAHDFNNLLTAISGHCDLLLLHHDQGDAEYSDLVQIHQNANRAAGLVGQLLAFSRKQTMKSERVDLQDALADLTHLLDRLVGEKVELDLQQNAELPHIRGDKRQLEQVIMNLVVNARDAMSGRGRIVIETGQQIFENVQKIGRAKVPAGTYAVVRVKDFGTGIAPETLEKIFEPFFTTKRTGEGTGLGLSTAYGIVKQSGGFIFVDSVMGQGSTFSLMFPACEATDNASENIVITQIDEPLQFEEGVVLLVEDEAPVRAFASRALSHCGFTVIEAENAEAALEVLQDESLDVDVFVTDVVMPGLDGPSWVREARTKRPDVPVVFMSGYAEDVFKSQGKRIDCSAFIAKPFSLTELTTVVNRQLVRPN